MPDASEKVVRVSKPGETRLADRFARGDVLLLKASWLMARAGYDAADVQAFTSFRRTRKWVRKRAARPLPCRQDIEAYHPEAVMSAEDVSLPFDRILTTADLC